MSQSATNSTTETHQCVPDARITNAPIARIQEEEGPGEPGSLGQGAWKASEKEGGKCVNERGIMGSQWKVGLE